MSVKPPQDSNATDPGSPMLGALLRIPFQETVRRIQLHLAAVGFGDLRPAHLTVFQHLDPVGTRQTELAERAQVTKQSMGYLVKHLLAGGYVELIDDPVDRRASLVRRTLRGDHVDREARTALAALEDEWANNLGARRYDELKTTLRSLTHLIQGDRTFP